jgi:dipeptidase
VLEAANQKMADELKEETDALLSKVLFFASMGMKNSFSKDDM